MPGQLQLKIAEIKIAIASEDPELELQVTGATRKFLVSGATADAQVQVAWGDFDRAGGGEKVFDSGGLWQLYKGDDRYCFEFTSSAVGAEPYKSACFDPSFSTGQVRLNRRFFDPKVPVYPLEYPLDELLVMNLLSRGRGVEIHGCGVVDSAGIGHLFVGQSGAGKTTMARLWQNGGPVRILSDDRIILRQTDGCLQMHGTPWHGEAELADAGAHPLSCTYLLARGPQNALAAQPAAAAVGRLFSCCFPPFYDPAGLEFTLGFLEHVVLEVPCYELRFVPDARVTDFIRTVLF